MVEIPPEYNHPKDRVNKGHRKKEPVLCSARPIEVGGNCALPRPRGAWPFAGARAQSKCRSRTGAANGNRSRGDGTCSICASIPDTIFKQQATAALHRLTQGIPRRINRLCDLALLIGFAEERKSIGAEHLESVAQELVAVTPE